MENVTPLLFDRIRRKRRGKRRNKEPSFCMFPLSGPILSIDQKDWFGMSSLDKHVYLTFKHHHPNGLSPEYVHKILSPHYECTLEEIWKSLDGPALKKYLFRKSKSRWNLITIGQIEAKNKYLQRG